MSASARRPRQPRAASDSPAFEFIETAGALAAFCKEVADGPIAVDTEFVGERTFHAVLELIQIADSTGRTALIDAKAVGKAAPLGKLLLDESREKIFHSGTQDLPILERLFGKAPWPIFDTQVAAAMVGLGAQVSYANLVEDLLGGRVDKGQTASDWSQRPLKPAQLEYAASDVAYLHELQAELLARLEKMGRLAWYREEQEKRFVESATKSETPDEELYTNVKEWGKLSGRQLAILRELAAWRESEARRQNVPRKKVMPDPGLIALARLGPESRDDLRNARQVPPGPAHRYADELVACIKKGAAVPRDQWPKKPDVGRPDVPAGFVELLQSLVRTMAEQEQIASTLLATSSELTALVNNRRRIDELDLPVLKGWRRELVGAKLIALLEGRLALRIVGRRLEFEEIKK